MALHNSPAMAIFVDETGIVNFVHLYLPVPAELRTGVDEPIVAAPHPSKCR